jgi:hypothetical protein
MVDVFLAMIGGFLRPQKRGRIPSIHTQGKPGQRRMVIRPGGPRQNTFSPGLLILARYTSATYYPAMTTGPSMPDISRRSDFSGGGSRGDQGGPGGCSGGRGRGGGGRGDYLPYKE